METPPQRNSMPPWQAQDTGSPDPCSRTRALCATAPPASHKRRPDVRPAWRTPGGAPRRAGGSVEVWGRGAPASGRSQGQDTHVVFLTLQLLSILKLVHL